MTVVITSTTSSQAELDHATSENWREPFVKPEPVPAKEPEVAEVEQPEAEEPKEADAAEPEAPKVESKPKKGGVDKRIDRITKEKIDFETKWKDTARELEEYKSREAQRNLETKAKEPEWDLSTEPTWEESSARGLNPDQHIKLHQSWEKKQAEAQQVEAAQHKIAQEYEGAISEFIKGHPEVGGAEKFNKTLRDAPFTFSNELITSLLEAKRPDVAWYLATNSVEAENIAKMSPRAQAFAVGQIAERLATSKAAPVPKSKVAPPPPIEPVTNAGSKGNLSIWDRDFPLSKMIEIRNKEQRSKGRR